MDKKKIYKRIKNGKGIEIFYRFSDDRGYTIRIDPKEDKVQLHTFNSEGNNVMKEENYLDEKIRFFSDFGLLMNTIEKEFPGIKIKL